MLARIRRVPDLEALHPARPHLRDEHIQATPWHPLHEADPHGPGKLGGQVTRGHVALKGGTRWDIRGQEHRACAAQSIGNDLEAPDHFPGDPLRKELKPAQGFGTHALTELVGDQARAGQPATIRAKSGAAILPITRIRASKATHQVSPIPPHKIEHFSLPTTGLYVKTFDTGACRNPCRRPASTTAAPGPA